MAFLLIQLLSAAGVALTIGLTWLVGWSRKARIDSVQQAIDRFRADFPNARVKAVAVDGKGRAALLELGDSAGLVAVIGDRMVTRHFTAAEVRQVQAGSELAIRLRDLTLPWVRLLLSGAESAAWSLRLGGSR